MSDGVELDWDKGSSPEELAAKFEELDDAVEDHLEDAINTVVTKIAADASENAPYETGWLSSNIRGIVVGWAGAVLSAAVGTNVDYGKWQEEGTDPYTIETSDGALHFEDGGEDVFVKSVSHPGLEPNPYLEPAIRDNREWANEQYEQAIQAAVDEVFG